jgi:hypothetical protein
MTEKVIESIFYEEEEKQEELGGRITNSQWKLN